MADNCVLSLVVSIYNEEKVIDYFYNTFAEIAKGFKWSYELIFVNDGSTDSSLDLLERISSCDSNVRVISFSRNFGHEAAMIAGIDYAVGDRIICMDVDLQHPLECIFPIMEKFDAGYDIINMVRVSNESAGFIKNITSKIYYKIINFLSEHKFKENASDFFAISSRVADVLRKNYREKSRFLRGYVQNVGFRSTELEYTATKRIGGESHYSIKKLTKYAISSVICFSDFPLKLGIYAGIINAALGLILLVYTLFTYQDAPSGYATIVILICFLFAALYIIIGIIGEYLAVLFSELKDRPIYIIDKMINTSSKDDDN